MNVTLLRFSNILFSALAPAAAHVLELPNKIALDLLDTMGEQGMT